VYEQVKQRIEIFSRKNGFVFNSIHNIQCKTPIENVLAMFQAARDSANGITSEISKGLK
jgi:uroporphyrinogen-III decarboxylase